VDVYLVIDTPEGGKKELPISEFIEKAHDQFDFDGTPLEKPAESELLPSHTFMFTGSVLVEQGDGPRQYIADYSGHVITLVTFGDELLSLPGIHDDANSALMWQIRSKHLPELDTPVILRLKPHRAPKPGAGEPKPEAAEPASGD